MSVKSAVGGGSAERSTNRRLDGAAGELQRI